MTVAARFADEAVDWLVPTWKAPANVHGFITTRNGRPTARELDLGPTPPDALDVASRDAIVENRERVGRFLPSPPVWLEQVHGCAVVSIDKRNLSSARLHPGPADAAVTRLCGVPIAVRVADCLPVLFADDGGTVVAAAHAGWRGLAAGVLEATVAAMRVDPAGLITWLGPAIGPRAFEVGADVRDALCRDDADARATFVPRGAGKWLADLPALARRRLAAAGVLRVNGGEHCTFSDASRFFSYRRDATSARMAAFVWRSVR